MFHRCASFNPRTRNDDEIYIIEEEDLAQLDVNPTEQAEDVAALGTIDYCRYLTEMIRLPDEMEDLPSLEFCLLQQENLLKDTEAVEEVSEHIDGKPLCQLCGINAATRVIVPCGHWGGCYDCIKLLVNTERYYQYTTANGGTEESDRKLPKTCLTCRAIIGKMRVF